MSMGIYNHMCLLLAVNLVHWFKRLCLVHERWTDTLDSIRIDLLVLPARSARTLFWRVGESVLPSKKIRPFFRALPF